MIAVVVRIVRVRCVRQGHGAVLCQIIRHILILKLVELSEAVKFELSDRS